MQSQNNTGIQASNDINRTPQSALDKKKILLVSPDSGTIPAERHFFAPPLGVLRLAGYLNSKGHQAEYYDPNLYACDGNGPSLLEKFQEQEWDIIGFSVLDETMLQDIENMYAAKKICPGALMIAGGIEAQFKYQTFLDKSPCRIVILGEGETPLLMLANGEPWEKIPGIVLKNLAEALSQELFNEATQTIPWETINYEAYWDVYATMYGDQWNDEIADQVRTVRVFSRNRCPIGCKYCSSTFQLTQATGGKVPVVSTTEENLVSVIERIVKAHPGVRMIYLTDDDFVINKPSVIRFCKQVIEKDFGDLIFMCFARITDLTEDVVQWMSKANFRKLNIGVESFSQRVLDEVGKRCDVEQIHTSLNLLKKYDIRPYCNIILSTPKSTLEDLEITLDNIIQYLSDDFYMAGIIPAIIPLKGTDFFEMYWDFKSHVVEIHGTDYLLRRDDYIHAEDPLMREFQARYIAGEDAVARQYAEEKDIRHLEASGLARIKCQFAKRLIAEIREEAANGSMKWIEGNTDGEARSHKQGLVENSSFPYAKRAEPAVSADPDLDGGRPGDSTRHMLV